MFFLHNVRYILELNRNLLSMSMFNVLKYCIRVEHGVSKISHGEVIETLFIDQIKSIYLNDKVVDSVFNHRWITFIESINRRWITFTESCQEKKTKYLRMKLLETMAEKTQFKVNVSTISTSSNERKIINALDYYLIWTKVMREIVSSQRDNYVRLECYSLNVAEGL